MMQNGFRRIALAQGLLPERMPSREVPANVEPSAAPPANATEAGGTQSDTWDGGVAMRVASPA